MTQARGIYDALMKSRSMDSAWNDSPTSARLPSGFGLHFEENSINPRSVTVTSGDGPNLGEPIWVRVAADLPVWYGYWGAWSDALLIAFHNMKPMGIVSHCGEHYFWLVRGSKIKQVNWEAKAKLFGGTKVLYVEVTVEEEAGNPLAVRIETPVGLDFFLASTLEVAHSATGGDPPTPDQSPGVHTVEFG